MSGFTSLERAGHELHPQHQLLHSPGSPAHRSLSVLPHVHDAARDEQHGEGAEQPGQPANEQGQLLGPDGNVVMETATKTDTWARGGGATQHLVAVTGMTAEGNFIVCDPAHPDSRPIEVTPAQLDAFMRGNAGAMSVDGTP